MEFYKPYNFTQKEKTAIIANVILLLLAFFYNLDLLPLQMEEPRRVIVAMEMSESGNYIVPKIFGENYYNKPPLFNWWIILFSNITGSFSALTARIASLTALLLLGIVNYFFVKQNFNKAFAVISSLFILTSAHIFFFFSLLGEIDLFYTLIVYLQVICIYHFYQRKQWCYLFLFSYFYAALGVLTKGLPSVAFQGITLLVLFVANKNFKGLFSLAHLSGIILFLVITGGYFYVYSFYEDVNPFLIRLFNESSGRMDGEGGFPFHLLTNPLMLFQVCMPWAVLLLLLIKKKTLVSIKQHPLLRFSLLFILFNFIVYWISPETRPRYLFIFVPFISILAVHCCREYYTEKINRITDLVFFVISGILLLASIVLPFVPQLVLSDYALIEGIALIVIGLIVITGHMRSKTNAIFMVIGTVIIARLFFDVFIIHHRSEMHSLKNNEKYMEQVYAITGDQPVYFTGRVKTTTRQWGLPVLDNIPPSKVKETPFFPYDLSIYMHALSGTPIYFNANPKVGDYCIAHPKFIEKTDQSPLFQFKIEKTDQEYYLFRYAGVTKNP